MSEFKFACPVCTQHIRCDSAQSGTVMDCPTCFQKIIVPMAPESPDSKLILTGQKFVEKKPPTVAPASLAPPTSAGGLPLALIAGVLVFVLGAGAALAFWHFHAPPAPPEPPPQLAVSPVTEPAKTPVLVIPPANGTNWLMDLENANIPPHPVAGRIHGLDFLAERVQLQNGILTLRAGTRGPLQSGVQINFQGAQPEALAGQTINVETDTDKAASITLRWKTDDQVQKESYNSGYALHLEFGVLDKNRLPGKIYLCLPDPEKSYLMGTFTADTRKPRPKHDQK